jgi:hypothetical protein
MKIKFRKLICLKDKLENVFTLILKGGSSKVRSMYLSPRISGDLCLIFKDKT